MLMLVLRYVFGKKYLLSCLLAIVSASAAQANYRIGDRTNIITQELSSDSVFIKVDNDFFIPVSVVLNLRLENLIIDSTQIASVVPAKASGFVVAKFKRIIPGAPYKCSYNWRIVLGDVSKFPDINYFYRYPYKYGTDFRISQGPGGAFSHKNSFAFDFAMPIGTPIVAIRDGVVAALRSDSKVSGRDSSYLNAANFISVFHDDGTIARYVHLNTNGVIVQEGQYVQRGQVIGYSGNTGYTTGPHLHLEIVQPHLSSYKTRYVSFNWEKPVFMFSSVNPGPFKRYSFVKSKGAGTKVRKDNSKPGHLDFFKTAYSIILSIFS